MQQFHYSRTKFHTTIAISGLLTAIVTLLIYVIMTRLGMRNIASVLIISALVFFSFCSAVMIYRFYLGDPIVAFRPDGILDVRLFKQVVPWEQVKEVRLEQLEQEYRFRLFLWPNQSEAVNAEGYVIETSMLNADIQTILAALQGHVDVKLIGEMV